MAGETYAAAGVSIDAQDRAVALFRDAVRGTHGPRVLADIGAFGGLFAFDGAGLSRPALVASVDSVGTKVLVAADAGQHRHIGHDIVHHCVNDIAVMGAEPLFFLDYYASPRLVPEHAGEIVRSIAEACRALGCAVLGGELAELPGMYREGTYDLVGAIVGVVDQDAILDGSSVVAGDVVLGLASHGLHTNGFSLARRVLLERAGLSLGEEIPELGGKLADVLLAPHRCYLPALRALRRAGLLKAAAHITGGGLRDNLPRVLPAGLGATLAWGRWPVPPIFELIRRLGGVPDLDWQRTFNLGLGMLLVVGREFSADARAVGVAAGYETFEVGVIHDGAGVTIEVERGTDHG